MSSIMPSCAPSHLAPVLIDLKKKVQAGSHSMPGKLKGIRLDVKQVDATLPVNQ